MVIAGSPAGHPGVQPSRACIIRSATAPLVNTASAVATVNSFQATAPASTTAGHLARTIVILVTMLAPRRGRAAVVVRTDFAHCLDTAAGRAREVVFSTSRRVASSFTPMADCLIIVAAGGRSFTGATNVRIEEFEAGTFRQLTGRPYLLALHVRPRCERSCRWSAAKQPAP